MDCIVVGAGFCGSVIARKLAEQGLKVKIIERRSHIAGNMYDEKNDDGILIQKYGPHAFHTYNKEVFDFLKKHGEWIPFFLKCRAEVEGKTFPMPFNYEIIDHFYSKEKAMRIKKTFHQTHPNLKKIPITTLLKSENSDLRAYATFLFEMDYGPYTAKQWNIPLAKIDISILERVPVLFSDDSNYFDDTFQCLPKHGFTKFFEQLLAHKNIEIVLNQDVHTVLELDTRSNKMYFEKKELVIPLVYTGELDRLFASVYGDLPYRSLRFEYETHKMDSFQDAPVVAHPKAEGFTRITEYKKIPIQEVLGKTCIAKEFPISYTRGSKNDPYYPILTKESNKLHQKYLALANQITGLFICGRLADFRYYNMDQAIERAFEAYHQVLEGV